jgi:hypothetical protein
MQNPKIVSFDRCEFQVAYPFPVKSKEMSHGGMRWVQYTNVWTGSTTNLRAEGYYTGPTAQIIASLRSRLTQIGESQVLSIPVVEIQKTKLGTVGIVYGTREYETPAGEVRLKHYNKIIVGKTSLILLMASGPVDGFPSAEAMFFLESISIFR